MSKQGFQDANGGYITTGTLVEHEDHPGVVAEVTDLTQDGDVSVRLADGQSITSKWRQVVRLPPAVARSRNASKPQQQTHQEFWMVYGWNQRPPNATHMSEDRARAEAERLARENKGIQFFVLKAIGGYLLDPPPPPPLTEVVIDPDEIPF